MKYLTWNSIANSTIKINSNMRALSIYPSRILSQNVLKNMRKVKDAWIKSQESNSIGREF